MGPLDKRRRHGALPIAGQRGEHAEAIRIDAGDDYRGHAEGKNAPRIRGASEQSLGAIRAADDPAKKESTVTIGPDKGEQRQQPQPAARFENGHEREREGITEKSGPIMREGG